MTVFRPRVRSRTRTTRDKEKDKDTDRIEALVPSPGTSRCWNSSSTSGCHSERILLRSKRDPASTVHQMPGPPVHLNRPCSRSSRSTPTRASALSTQGQRVIDQNQREQARFTLKACSQMPLKFSILECVGHISRTNPSKLLNEAAMQCEIELPSILPLTTVQNRCLIIAPRLTAAGQASLFEGPYFEPPWQHRRRPVRRESASVDLDTSARRRPGGS